MDSEFLDWHGLESWQLVDHLLESINELEDYWTKRKVKIRDAGDLHDHFDVKTEALSTIEWLKLPLPADGDPAYEAFYDEMLYRLELHFTIDY